MPNKTKTRKTLILRVLRFNDKYSTLTNIDVGRASQSIESHRYTSHSVPLKNPADH